MGFSKHIQHVCLKSGAALFRKRFNSYNSSVFTATAVHSLKVQSLLSKVISFTLLKVAFKLFFLKYPFPKLIRHLKSFFSPPLLSRTKPKFYECVFLLKDLKMAGAGNKKCYKDIPEILTEITQGIIS